MNTTRKNKFILFASIIFLVSGIVLVNETIRLSLIRFVNTAFSLSLDELFRAIGIFYLATCLILFGSILLLYFVRSRDRINQSGFYTISISLAVLHYFFHLTTNAVNFPVYDDQGAILDFLVSYSNLSTFSEKLRLAWLPYNESVLFLPKLFVLCWTKITGEINFKYLIIFNGILLSCFHFFLFRKAENQKATLSIFLICTVFVFQFQYFDDSFWAISGLSYYGVMVFALLTFHFLRSKSSSRRYLALTFSLLAIFTFGNGLILFPLSISYLLLGRRTKEVLPWSIVFALMLVYYYVARPHFHMLTTVSYNLYDNILFILVFLGSAFQFFYTIHIPVFVGLFILSVFIWATIRRLYITSPVYYLMLAFIICSAIMASPLRSGLEENGQYGLRVRYGIFSIYAFVLSVSLLLANREIRKTTLYLLFALAFSYNALTGIFFFPEVVVRKERLEKVVSDIKQNKFSVNYSTFRKDDVEMLLKDAMEKRIYKP